MMEMVYSSTRTIDVLDRGTYHGYDYAVLSYGTHPCAYVRIPEDHPYFKQKYTTYTEFGEFFTYSDGQLITDKGTEKGWWIGWDYANASDYRGFFPEKGGQKHSTAEMVKKCYSVIDELSQIGNKQ